MLNEYPLSQKIGFNQCYNLNKLQSHELPIRTSLHNYKSVHIRKGGGLVFPTLLAVKDTSVLVEVWAGTEWGGGLSRRGGGIYVCRSGAPVRTAFLTAGETSGHFPTPFPPPPPTLHLSLGNLSPPPSHSLYILPALSCLILLCPSSAPSFQLPVFFFVPPPSFPLPPPIGPPSKHFYRNLYSLSTLFFNFSLLLLLHAQLSLPFVLSFLSFFPSSATIFFFLPYLLHCKKGYRFSRPSWDVTDQ